MSKRILIFIATLSLVLGACSPKSNDNNTHEATPQVESRPGIKSELASQDIQDAMTLLETKRSLTMKDIRLFFEIYLTEEFFLKYSVEKNPKDVQILQRFHTKIILLHRSHKNERDAIRDFSMDYYMFLRNRVCSEDFQECDGIKIFSGSVFAAEVFLYADKIVRADLRDQYVQFVTNIGHPENNIQIQEFELAELMKKMKSTQDVALDDLRRLSNLSLYLTIKTDKIQIEPLKALERLSKQYPDHEIIKSEFEKTVVASLQIESDNATVNKIAENMIVSVLKEVGIFDLLSKEESGSLISWKDDVESFNLDEDWKEGYIFLGFVLRKYAGELNQHLALTELADTSTKLKVLKMAEAYIAKKFVENVHKSHDHIADVWLSELAKWGKVEAIFYTFYQEANPFLADLWNLKFADEMYSLSNNLSQFYSVKEMQQITYTLSQIGNNVKHFVGMPAQYIVGYFATQQGDFDFETMSRTGAILHMNDNTYFNELFEGRTPNFFTFIQSEQSRGQESILAFYNSLDEKVLKAYGLDMDFLPEFIHLYLETERNYLLDKSQWLDRLLLEEGVADQMFQRCTDIKAGNFDFEYELKFSAAGNQHFFGQAYYMSGGQSKGHGNFGTSPELSDFINQLAYPDIGRALSEDMEVLRTDIGAKLNRFKLINQALIEQGHADTAKEAQKVVDDLNRLVNSTYSRYKNHYLKTLDCIQIHTQVEEDMRIEFMKHEIKYIQSTYQALKILDGYGENVPDLAQVRVDHPAAFQYDYLKDLPGSGDFLAELNKRWMQMGRKIRRQVLNYDVEVGNQLGFRILSNKKYEFYTNKFEDRFRKLYFHENSELYGVKYPKSKILDIPIDYDTLNILYGKNRDHFYGVKIIGSTNTEQKFVAHVFESHAARVGGFATNYEMDNAPTWRHLILNYASLVKFEAFKLFRDDFDYAQYQEKVDAHITPLYEKLAGVTNTLLTRMNISEDEEAILDLIDEPSMIREDKRYAANYLFVYHPGYTYRPLGQYDIFFNALTAFHLGKKAEVRVLFNNGYTAENPLVADWLPRKNNDAGGGPGGPGGHVKPEDLFYRRNNRFYTQYNANFVKEFDKKVLMRISPTAKNYLQHDYFHAMAADNALADSFMGWVKARENSGLAKVPYWLDRSLEDEPIENPDYLLRNTIKAYNDSRNTFDFETLQAFQFDK